MILTRTALYPQERLDVPDARAIEAFGQNDWSYFLKGIISSKSLIVSGFDVSNWGNIFTVPGVKIRQNNVSLIHPEAKTQAMGFYISSGSETDYTLVLNPDATNFVEVDLKTEGGARDVRAFWDPAANGGAGGEYTDTVDTVINLALNITVNVSGFGDGRIPLYKIVTDSDGKVVQITDCRPMFFRLGTGGSSPDPSADYSFRSTPDLAHSRFETAVTATKAESNNQVFQGGDKNIRSLKEWMDVVMTQLKRGMNLPYWYASPRVSLAEAYQNSALTFLTGGYWKHLGRSSPVTEVSSTSIRVQSKNDLPTDASFTPSPSSVSINGQTFFYTLYDKESGLFSGVTPNPVSSGVVVGQIAAQGSLGHLALEDGSVLVRLGKANCTLSAFQDVNLNTQRVLFAILPIGSGSVAFSMGQDGASPVVPMPVTARTINTITVAGDGNYRTNGGTLLIKGQSFSYTGFQPQTGLFSGVSPDPTGLVAGSDLVFQDSNGGSAYYHQAQSQDVPSVSSGVSEGAERVFWLAYFDGTNTIIIRDSELVPGERVEVGNDTASQVFQYIGSTGAADNFPVYRVNTISDGTDLTKAIQKIYQILETPIYDEILPDSSGNGWAADDVVSLPPNSRAFGETAQYTMGSGELEVYDNGVYMRNGYDYVEYNSQSIRLLRPVFTGSYIRFRVSSVGGAGAAAGGGTAGADIQAVYNNGSNVLVQSGRPVVIDGAFNEKLLHIKGGLQVDGLIDPTGLELAKQSENPITTLKMGIWVHDDGHLKYTKEDGTIINLSGVVERLDGDTQYFFRKKRNETGATIPSGAPVYIKIDGTIALADADDETAATFFGIAAESIPSGSTGKVIYQGVVPGVLGGLGLATGSYLWLSTTPGGMSPVSPDSPGAYLRVIGIVDGDDLILQQQVSGQVGY